MNRFLLEETYVRAKALDYKIMEELARLYNNNIDVKYELRKCQNFEDIYMTDCLCSTLP